RRARPRYQVRDRDAVLSDHHLAPCLDPLEVAAQVVPELADADLVPQCGVFHPLTIATPIRAGSICKEPWWRRVGSNHRQHDYESCALPLSYAATPGGQRAARALALDR